MSTNKNKVFETVEFPQSVKCELSESKLKVTGAKGTIEKKLVHPLVKILLNENKITLQPTNKKYTKKDKKMLKTFKAHIKNLIIGVTEGYTYHLKIVSGHFPITVSIEGNKKVVIKNFLGEKVPRIAYLLPNVKIVIKNEEIIIESIDKEFAGQSAANIESATRITNRDRRVFQDGIYITEKPKRTLK